MNSKQIGIAFACVVITILNLCLVSATITEELLSNDVTQLDITISQNESLIEFYLNIEGTSFDLQDIEYEDLLIENIPISTIISEIDFRVEYNDGEQYPELTYFYVAQPSLTSFIFDNVLTYLDYDFDCDELNQNVALAQEVLQPYLDKLEMQGNSYFEKDGNDYALWADYGYEDITNFEQGIAQVIETAFYSINPAHVIPFDVPYLDLDFEISADLSDIKYENGEYEIVVSIGETEKVITLILEDIEFDTTTYIPEDSEVLEVIESISGLAPGTVVSIELIEDSPYDLPSALKAHQILNITTSQETDGWITFKVLKSEVTNKSNVALYIWEDAWNELLTNLTNEDGDYYTYISQTPHFSIFMIGETIVEEDDDDDDTSGGGGGGGSFSDDDDDDDDDEPTISVCDDGLACFGNTLYNCFDDSWEIVEVCAEGCENGKCKGEIIILDKGELTFFEEYKLPIMICSGVFILTILILVTCVKKKPEEIEVDTDEELNNSNEKGDDNKDGKQGE